MKKLLSLKHSATAFNITFLLLRVVLGTTMCINHGYDKLVHFADRKDRFVDLWGMGSPLTLALVIFAEFFCSIFLVLGLFTRMTVVPLIIAMMYAFFISNNAQLFGKGESAALFLSGFFAILLCGPGRISVDGLIQK
ncbi:MAG TPA: DoxX family protein [Lacibacter sp.]|nr:DoxX family protein [Lacibacter sp.]HMO89601.1 DoxX family protein [Lacibacter sp.]HMP86067.1 DoxX family protein [Lacibacter sp.]